MVVKQMNDSLNNSHFGFVDTNLEKLIEYCFYFIFFRRNLEALPQSVTTEEYTAQEGRQ